jgi:hypothetical protein
VQAEFGDNGEERFRSSFDVAIFQVARFTNGFWKWARMKHRFTYSIFIQNWYYNGECDVERVCRDNGETMFVHAKLT